MRNTVYKCLSTMLGRDFRAEAAAHEALKDNEAVRYVASRYSRGNVRIQDGAFILPSEQKKQSKAVLTR